MYLFIFVVLLLYVLVIGLLIYGFDKVETYNLKNGPRKFRFSIVVPFRNESQHLHELLHSLSSIDYPTSHIEILLIDDASEDNSREIIEEFQKTSSLNLKVLENERKSGSPKKDAIEKAVSCAKNDWIVTTDADCKAPPYWLESLNSFINDHGFRFIIAPIAITKSNKLWSNL